MAERRERPERAARSRARPRAGGGAAPALAVRGLNVFHGASHALQGVDLTLERGALSVVGRNGMGKTTLCRAIMGLVPARSGEIAVAGESVLGRSPAEIAGLGVGYVPQGRRLWPSLTVDEHLAMSAGRPGPWSVERVYAEFPRLAERRGHGGGQLSGGEQQMLAIARALLLNPRLLVMDEPTEGLAPTIVARVTDMLVQLAEGEDIAILVIEQNIGVATAVSERVAIMVNGRIDRAMDGAGLARDRELQHALLGVGRRAGAAPAPPAPAREPRPARTEARAAESGPRRIYLSNPEPPTRWSRPAPVRAIENAARFETARPAAADAPAAPARTARAARNGRDERFLVVAGTYDTKGAELRYMRDILAARGLEARTVDLSTSGRPSGADAPPHQVAAFHPRGASAVFTRDRGSAVAGMTLAFERWMRAQAGVAGAVAAGGSGGTAMAAPAFRALPVGVPKVIVSTVASGDVAKYVGPSDILMLHSVADIQGLNAITREVLANGAAALAGAAEARRERRRAPASGEAERPLAGLTMFGVTTPCVRRTVAALEDEFECLVFHATGIGGRAMETLVDDGLISGVVDLTTTEVCDMFADGIFPATEDRFGAPIRAGMPYVGACGALDMATFGPPETVPERYRGRNLYPHNPQITLMRTDAAENARMGRWIGERLNAMEAPVRFLMPEGGVSQLDAPGQPFHDPAANAALFDALERTVRQTADRRLLRLPLHINDPAFADEAARAFRALHGNGRAPRRAEGARR